MFGKTLGSVPDLDNAQALKAFFELIKQSKAEALLTAYHDRSDGGLFACVAEMCFAGHCGVDLDLDHFSGAAKPVEILFNEELGAVVQLAEHDLPRLCELADQHGLKACVNVIGRVNDRDELAIRLSGRLLFSEARHSLQRCWSETSYHMQALRDNSDCAQEEFEGLLDVADPGLHAELTFDLDDDICAPFIHLDVKPKVAVLREQGVNGQIEMAAAFVRAGFEAIDVHMTDLIESRVSLEQFNVMVACGGFSYGDVLGAGGGWAKSVLFNERLSRQFRAFFEREATLSLGVCNGCQMISLLHPLIPGAEHWPRFMRNRSEQFEGRLVMAAVSESPSVLLRNMQGSRFPIAVAHGEGFAHFEGEAQYQSLVSSGGVAMRYVDGYGASD